MVLQESSARTIEAFRLFQVSSKLLARICTIAPWCEDGCLVRDVNWETIQAIVAERNLRFLVGQLVNRQGSLGPEPLLVRLFVVVNGQLLQQIKLSSTIDEIGL